MFQKFMDDFRESTGSALRLTSLAIAVAVSLFITTAFLCAAAFVFVLERYGLLYACLAGAAVFFVEPQRYWEPAENKWITHYAKVVVDAYASGEGWNALVGLPVEIQPLTRPTGLWTGNEFRGIVLRDGKPVPFAEIEVEFVNDGSIKAPNEAFDTQVITADQSGVFGYAMPRAGWWTT